MAFTLITALKLAHFASVAPEEHVRGKQTVTDAAPRGSVVAGHSVQVPFANGGRISGCGIGRMIGANVGVGVGVRVGVRDGGGSRRKGGGYEGERSRYRERGGRKRR